MTSYMQWNIYHVQVCILKYKGCNNPSWARHQLIAFLLKHYMLFSDPVLFLFDDGNPSPELCVLIIAFLSFIILSQCMYASLNHNKWN